MATTKLFFQEDFENYRPGQSAVVPSDTAKKALDSGAAVEICPGQPPEYRGAAFVHMRKYLRRKIQAAAEAELEKEQQAAIDAFEAQVEESASQPEEPEAPKAPKATNGRRPAKKRGQYRRRDMQAEKAE